MANPTVAKEEAGDSRPSNGPPESAGENPATTTAAGDGPDRRSKDLIFGLLSNQRRRWVLRYLAENGPETTLSDLAEHIASLENDKPIRAVTSSERKRVYIALYQMHLPKMDDTGFIDFNQHRGTVELRPEADQLYMYLTVDRPDSDPTEPWYQRLIPAPLRDLGARVVEVNPVDLVRDR
jgi:hypothetical protein